jgi:hypothetical protein
MRAENQKKPRRKAGLSDQLRFKLTLLLNNISSSRTLGTFDDLKSYPSTLLEGFETFGLDGSMMNEYVIATILLDKTETLSIIKPLHCSFRHLKYSLALGPFRTT